MPFVWRRLAVVCGLRGSCPGDGELLGGLRAGGDAAVSPGRIPQPGGLAGIAWSLAGPAEQAVDRVGELFLGRAGLPGAGVVPGHLAERGGDPVQLGPEHGDPAAVPVVADPDPGHVIGVAVDLPPVVVLFDAGGLLAE